MTLNAFTSFDRRHGSMVLSRQRWLVSQAPNGGVLSRRFSWKRPTSANFGHMHPKLCEKIQELVTVIKAQITPLHGATEGLACNGDTEFNQIRSTTPTSYGQSSPLPLSPLSERASLAVSTSVLEPLPVAAVVFVPDRFS